jgi:hypothetical protein
MCKRKADDGGDEQGMMEPPSPSSSERIPHFIFMWMILLSIPSSLYIVILNELTLLDGRGGKGWYIRRKRTDLRDIKTQLGSYRFERSYRVIRKV